VNDNALMQRVAAGETAQLAILFERHHRPLYRYLFAMRRDAHAAEDLVQEVFVRILRYRASFNVDTSTAPGFTTPGFTAPGFTAPGFKAPGFTAWMYQIARNAAVDQGRKHRAVVEIDEYVERREFASTEADPEAVAVRKQDVELLRRALDLLPTDKREVLELSRFQGLKHEEIARLLGCEVNTVKVKVFRAIRALEQIYVGLERERAS
jgi:RNA polymerase sigma factor (sigma-70 family)